MTTEPAWDYDVALAIVGSRAKWWHPRSVEPVKAIIRATLTLWRPDAVISGRSPGGGVDVWAEELARELGFPFLPFPPRARTTAAYHERDLAMAEACTHLLCIESRLASTHGARWTYDRAEERGRFVGLMVL